jgi:hypothetical protein
MPAPSDGPLPFRRLDPGLIRRPAPTTDYCAVTDEHGRVWRGEASTLSLVQPGTGAVGPVLQGVDAFSVAFSLATVSPDHVDVAAESCR